MIKIENPNYPWSVMLKVLSFSLIGCLLTFALFVLMSRLVAFKDGTDYQVKAVTPILTLERIFSLSPIIN